MGIIKQQSISGTIYTYLGVILGFVNTVLLFPKLFSSEQIGLFNVIIAYAMVFSLIGNLGFTSATIRMFPYFKDEKQKHNGFLFLAVIISLIGFLITMIIFYFFKTLMIQNQQTSPLLIQYIYFIPPLIFFTIFFTIFDYYYQALYNAVVGMFLREFAIRFFIFIALLFYFVGIFTFNNFIIGYIIAYCLPALIIVIMLIREKQFNLKPNFKFITKNTAKTLASVSLFGIIAGFAATAISTIDRIMLERIKGLSDTGVYSIAMYIGTLVIMPSRTLLRITSAMIADAFKNNDSELINKIYYKSCISQTIIGFFLFLGIWVNIENLLNLLPPEYAAGRYVILFIGFAMLFDMITGASSNIIGNSKYYRWQTYFIIVLLVLLIGLNYLLIPIWGITGCAIASAIAKLISNFFRYIFILKKLNMQPYNKKYFLIILFVAIAYTCGYCIPTFSSVITDILVRSIVVSIIYGGLIIIFKISDDINSSFYNIIQNISSITKNNSR